MAEAVPIQDEFARQPVTLRETLRKLRDYASLDPAAAERTNLGVDIALGMTPGLGTAMAGRDFERARREDSPFGMGLAALSAVPIVGKPAAAAGKALKSSIKGAKRMAFPGVYKDAKTLANEAEDMVAVESPNLAKLFGVTRADLAKMAEAPGTAPGVIPLAAPKPRGTAHGAAVMDKENTARLVNALRAGEEYAPRLMTGMKGWYITDPAFARAVELLGPEEAVKRFERLNALQAMASPSSDVVTEVLRGSAANKLAQEGRFEDFAKYAGMTLEDRIAQGLPEDIIAIPSHAYHGTAQYPAMEKFLSEGSMQMKSPKVPLYEQASRPSAIGRQSDIPVGDAHWSRAVGLPDVRGLKTVKGVTGPNAASVSRPELQELAPWWREQVAGEVGLEAVPGQASAWGLFAPQTGVETAVGAPKLEIISDLIAQKAEAERLAPALVRDKYLTGEMDLNYLARALRNKK